MDSGRDPPDFAASFVCAAAKKILLLPEIRSRLKTTPCTRAAIGKNLTHVTRQRPKNPMRSIKRLRANTYHTAKANGEHLVS